MDEGTRLNNFKFLISVNQSPPYLTKDRFSWIILKYNFQRVGRKQHILFTVQVWQGTDIAF